MSVGRGRGVAASMVCGVDEWLVCGAILSRYGGQNVSSGGPTPPVLVLNIPRPHSFQKMKTKKIGYCCRLMIA